LGSTFFTAKIMSYICFRSLELTITIMVVVGGLPWQ